MDVESIEYLDDLVDEYLLFRYGKSKTTFSLFSSLSTLSSHLSITEGLYIHLERSSKTGKAIKSRVFMYVRCKVILCQWLLLCSLATNTSTIFTHNTVYLNAKLTYYTIYTGRLAR
mgnify:CR=1 FL=1